MADRPILFSGPMVSALLTGRKTQTRRIMKVQPPKEEDFPGSVFGINRKVADGVKMFSLNDYDRLPKHPTYWDLDGSVGVARKAGFPHVYDARFAIGDRLWVREAYRVHRAYDDLKPSELGGDQDVWPELDRDNCDAHGRYRHGRFMPRWASRLTLKVTNVRVERLQAITLGDICAEGIGASIYDFKAVQRGFAEWTALWDSINGDGAWAANPWIVALTFEVHRPNIDQLPAHSADCGSFRIASPGPCDCGYPVRGACG